MITHLPPVWLIRIAVSAVWLYEGLSCTAQWDGRDDRGSEVSSGVYFYELRGGAFVDRRRMVLLR